MRHIYFIVYFLGILNAPLIFSQELFKSQKIFASDRDVNDNFGQHVQIFHDFAFVSAPTEGDEIEAGRSTTGAVYVFKIDSNGYWIEVQKLVGSGLGYLDNFGSGIERSGNTLIIGAHSHEINGIKYAGAAYIFELDSSGHWVETQKLMASDKSKRAHFGIDVSISGDYVIIGSYAQKLDEKGKNPLREAGAAYIFKRDFSGYWLEQKKIVSPYREENGRFGLTVFMSGNYLAVGAVFEKKAPCNLHDIERAGILYMYELDNQGHWNYVQRVSHSDREKNDSFGTELIISNDDMFVTSVYKEMEGKKTVGAVYYFQRGKNGLWCEKQKITPFEPQENDYFGHSIAIHNDILLIGGGWWNKIGTGYLFKKNECGLWQPFHTIRANSTEASLDDSDHFGGYVSLSKNHALIGACDDHHAPGQQDLYDAGSAFIFSLINFDSTRVKCDSNQTIISTYCNPCETNHADENENDLPDNDLPNEENSNDSTNPENEQELTPVFEVSPHINSGQFSIKIIGSINRSYQVIIKKPFSRTVLKLTLVEKITNVDLRKESTGLYIVKITTEEGVKTIPIYIKQTDTEPRN